MQFPDHSRSTLVGERLDAGVLLLNFASRLLQEMPERGRRVGAFSILLTVVPLWCSPLPVGTSLLRVPSAAPDIPSRGRFLLRGRTVEDR